MLHHCSSFFGRWLSHIVPCKVLCELSAYVCQNMDESTLYSQCVSSDVACGLEYTFCKTQSLGGIIL